MLKVAGPLHEERRRALVAGADLFRRDPALAARLRGPLLIAMRVARRFPHLGTAAAHWLLLFGGRHAVPAVDEGVARVVARLAPDAARVRQPFRHVRRAIRAAAATDLAALRRASLYLSHHGRPTCLALAPHCAVRPLRPTGPTSRQGVGVDSDPGEGRTQGVETSASQIVIRLER